MAAKPPRSWTLPSVRFPYGEPRDFFPPSIVPFFLETIRVAALTLDCASLGGRVRTQRGWRPGFTFLEHDDPSVLVWGPRRRRRSRRKDGTALVGQASLPAPERAPWPIRVLLSPFLAHQASHWGQPQMPFPPAELGCCLPWEPRARTLQLPGLTCAPAPHLGGLELRP